MYFKIKLCFVREGNKWDKWYDGDTSVCPICYDDCNVSNSVMLNCGHSFCGTCIEGILLRQRQRQRIEGLDCPYCRSQMNVFM